MIAYLQGEVAEKEDNSLILMVQGVGFQVFTTQEILSSTNPGETLALHCVLIVREDALTLYGYPSKAEKDLFQRLLAVNGVGPRSANAILSTLSVAAIRQAVQEEDALIISRVPGIGKKTALKIILQLQGTLEGKINGVDAQTIAEHQMLVDALTSLGYSVMEAQRAVQSLPKERPAEIEEQIRLALRMLSGQE